MQHPDLLIPPHLMVPLVDWFSGERVPTLSLEHLLLCPYCRAFFFLLTHLLHEEESRLYEVQAAYAETVVIRGTPEANRHYPEMVEHLEGCEECRALIEELIACLREEE